MRLWSLHPHYLDTKGLTAAWREALLARAVLSGQTRGYRRHPQLQRFLACATPHDAINVYLAAIHAEACSRNYAFDSSKLAPATPVAKIRVSDGQLAFELEHLRAKLHLRDPARLALLPENIRDAKPHPLFQIVLGPIEAWERVRLEAERIA